MTVTALLNVPKQPSCEYLSDSRKVRSYFLFHFQRQLSEIIKHEMLIGRTRTVEELDQRYILTPEKVKDAYLVHLIQTFTDQHDDWSIIIFTSTCK